MCARHANTVKVAHDLFTGAGLAVPPVPRRFAKRLRLVEPWCFATRTISGFDMYMFDDLIVEGLTSDGTEYLAFSHAGHGVNSYTINYFLLSGRLVLFTQTAWGGAYSDRERDTEDVKRLFDRCSDLENAMSSAKTQGLDKHGRLIVVESRTRELNSWGWLDGALLDGEAAHRWLDDHSMDSTDASVSNVPTLAARKWLKENS